MAHARGDHIAAPAPAMTRVASSKAVGERLYTASVGDLSRTSSRRSSVLHASGSAPALGVALTPDGKPYRYAPPPRTPITPMTKKEQLASSTRLSSRPSTSHEPVALPDASASTQKLKSLPGGKAFGFGASTRDVANKLFVSQHHTMSLMYGMQSPGPTKYSLPPSVGGKQPDGNKPDPPVWSMGNCERFLYGYGKPETKGIPPGRAGGMRPGPADYDPERPACVEEAVGPERGGRTIKQVPHWSMGKGTRDQTHKVWITKEITQALRAGSQSPAAQYNLPDANFDKRYNCGGKPDPPVWKLHGRPHLPDFKCAPPPGTYETPKGVGEREVNARLETRPSWSMADYIKYNDEPGRDAPPAKYATPPAAIERQVVSRRGNTNQTAGRATFTRHHRWAHVVREEKRNAIPGPTHYG